MKRCIPAEVKAAADAAARRLDDAIQALLSTAEEMPRRDEFEDGMRDLIDADKRVVSLIKRKAG